MTTKELEARKRALMTVLRENLVIEDEVLRELQKVCRELQKRYAALDDKTPA